MDFETRMRKVIKELVVPVIERQQEDRQNILKLKQSKKSHDDKISTLENTIFKSKDTSTIFDDFEQKFIKFEVNIKQDIERHQGEIDARFVVVDDRIFETNNRITSNDILKQQFEVFQEKQSLFDEQMSRYKHDLNDEFTKLKHDYNTNYFEVQNSIRQLTNKFNNLQPDIEEIKYQIKTIFETMQSLESKNDETNRQMIMMDHKKINMVSYKEDMKAVNDQLNFLSTENDENKNANKSLENWVEKYQPLRIQNQISETLKECLNRKGKMKLIDYDYKINEVLRQKILDDHGNPMLKEKVLDLMTRYERESVATSNNNLVQQMGESLVGSFQKQRESMISKKNMTFNGSIYGMKKQSIKQDDEDSENIDDLREQLHNATNQLIQDAFKIQSANIAKEFERIQADQKVFFDRVISRVDDLQSLQNDMKDELDRQNTRLQQNQSDMLQYNKAIMTQLRKIKSEQININEDILNIGTIIQILQETSQQLYSYLETQHHQQSEQIRQDPNGLYLVSSKQALHQSNQTLNIDNISLNKAQESLKRCGILQYKRGVKAQRNFTQSTDPISLKEALASQRKQNHKKNTSIAEIPKFNSNDQQRFQTEIRTALADVEKSRAQYQSQISGTSLMMDSSDHAFGGRSSRDPQIHKNSQVEVGFGGDKNINNSHLFIDSQEYGEVNQHSNHSQDLQIGLNSIKINDQVTQSQYHLGIFGRKAAAIQNSKVAGGTATGRNLQMMNSGRNHRKGDSYDIEIDKIYSGGGNAFNKNGNLNINDTLDSFRMKNSPMKTRRNNILGQSSIFPEISNI
ncbi:UNKNOWN [Stylonychia lemnae]|uniref:Uncharacterized protein n=1 Tax=Stylonychia lemnae TaxID=5949 RepID=A0A078ABP2_STYLE|nr:UNKNOWN [Stylonychia lemnae]|eukprot:CDW79604.1 UNKNOWN [Stylonychia lemnae]